MTPERVRACGAAAVVGSVLVLASAALGAVLPVPDSYQFDPALTSPQFLRDRVHPVVTVLGVTGHLAGHVALRSRDGGRFGAARAVGWWAVAAGLTGVVVGLVGLFATGPEGGTLVALADAAFALVTVLAGLVAGVGMLLFGAATLWTRADLALGALFALAPLAVAVGFLVPLGDAGRVALALYAAAWAALGYGLRRAPARPDATER